MLQRTDDAWPQMTVFLKKIFQKSKKKLHLASKDTFPRLIFQLRELHCTRNAVFHQEFLQQMWPKPDKTVDLVTFTEEIPNGKVHFLWIDWYDHFCKLER